METGQLAARQQIANERVAAAAQLIGTRFGVRKQASAVAEAFEHGPRDRQLAEMRQDSAVADLLEAVVTKTDRKIADLETQLQGLVTEPAEPA